MNSIDRAGVVPALDSVADVIVIGGGFAGFAAAVDLAEKGRKVLLLERRSFCGGRAYSLTDKLTGDVVDNGQHLMMGCYHHTLAFLKKIGTTDRLKFQASPKVEFLSPGGARATFSCPSLPAPLHLLAGLAGMNSITWGDKLRALRVGLELRKLNRNWKGLDQTTVSEWLRSLGQSQQMCERFWNPVALATLNERPEIASADMFARVLDQAFLHARQDSTMVISKVGLSDLYTEAATSFIRNRGGEVRLNASVKGITFDSEQRPTLELADGNHLRAASVICAVPYFALRTMLDPDLISREFPGMADLYSAPIVSINVWYKSPVTSIEFAGLLDSPIEWIFNKNLILGSHPDANQHLALVISGAHEFSRYSKEELSSIGVRELERFFPLARLQKPLHTYVIKEQNATLSHGVGVTSLRPEQRTSFKGFFLAGDWTRTGLPATIEGAVWSGQECARLALSAS